MNDDNKYLTNQFDKLKSKNGEIFKEYKLKITDAHGYSTHYININAKQLMLIKSLLVDEG